MNQQKSLRLALRWKRLEERGALPSPTEERVIVVLRATRHRWTKHALYWLDRHSRQSLQVIVVPEEQLYRALFDQWVHESKPSLSHIFVPSNDRLSIQAVSPMPGVNLLNMALTRVEDPFVVLLDDAATVGPDWLPRLLWPFYDDSSIQVIVCDPVLTPLVHSFSPRYWIALLTSNRLKLDESSKRCWDYTADNAPMLFTDSEQVYLEQCFRRENVYLFYSESNDLCDIAIRGQETLFLRDFEHLACTALQRLFVGDSDPALMKQQWRQRLNYYRNLEQSVEEHETIYFLIAVYSYLLELPEAEAHLLRSFELATLKGQRDLLTNHFRFRSSIQARRGELEQAKTTYEITAFTQSESQMVRTLNGHLQRGEIEIATARLYMINDDDRSALQVLRDDTSSEARRLRFQLYARLGRVDLAQATLDKETLPYLERAQYDVLLGWFEAMKGNIHIAIHHFLKAASIDQRAVDHILEMRNFVERIAFLNRGGKQIVPTTDSKIEE